MFCPKCSREQSSSDLRFCPRCGFRLEAVGELMANGGVPVRGPVETLLLRRDTRFGVRMLFLSGMIVPLALLAAAMWDTPFPIFGPAAVALLGMAYIGYRLIVDAVSSPSTVPEDQEAPVSITDAATTRLGLREDAMFSMPTNELRHPTSVEPPIATEETTENLRNP